MLTRTKSTAKSTIAIRSRRKNARRKNRGNPRTSFGFGAAFFTAAIVIPTVFFSVPENEIHIENGLLALNLTLLVYSSLRLSITLASDRISPFATIFWFFIYISMAVVPLAQSHTGLWTSLADPSLVVTGQSICLLACISFDLGAAFAHLDKPIDSHRLRGEVIRRRVVSAARLRVFTVIAVLLSANYIRTIGDITTFFASRRDLSHAFDAAGLRETSQVGSALLTMSGSVPIFIVALVWAITLLQNVEVRSRVEPWVALAICLACNLIVNNPISNPRFWILTIILATILCIPHLSAGHFRWTVSLGIVAALVIFPYTDIFREQADRRTQLSLRGVAETIATKDYDQSTMTANGVWWASQYGHTDGRQLLGALFFWVPRNVWPDKATDTGVEIGMAMGSANVNLSSPLWIEVWIDFSWVGVILFFILLGAGAARSDRAYHLAKSTSKSGIALSGILIPVLAGFSLIILRGPLLQSMSRLAAIIVVCYLLTSPENNVKYRR